MKPELQQYEAFVFDLDGTLIDSEKYHADGFARAVEILSGYRITEAERREFFEAHTSTFVPVLNERHGLNLDVDETLEHKRVHVRDHFKTDVFPDAIHFMKHWRARKRMALASNSPKHFVKNALVEGGMIDLFEAVCTADDVRHRKPDPEMYFCILDRLKLAPEEVLVFEDSPAGVRAAQAAGCPLVMIENGSDRTVEGVEKFRWRELS
ncbi:MAG TPA: HAD family phosphatase [Tichowtungia sp.]|nr:HAD family phosphatase [Tichowtungia sp.]